MKPPRLEPAFWALFGAGGTLSAILGPVLVFVTGIAVPLGLLLPHDTMRYPAMLAVARNPIGKLALLGVITLFLFHGCHRIFHTLHDVGIHPGPNLRTAFYGSASVASLGAAVLLLAIGF